MGTGEDRDDLAARATWTTLTIALTYIALLSLLFVLTPDGRVSRYLFGVQHDPQTLRLSLVEASEGGIGSPVDKFLLYCYRYDPDEGRYAPVAMQMMRVGGGFTIAILGTVLLTFWLREARHRRRKRLA